jgi:hypothetical protein
MPKLRKISKSKTGVLKLVHRLGRGKLAVVFAFMLLFAGVGTYYITNAHAATVNGSPCVYWKFTEYRFSGQCVKDIQFGLNRAGIYAGNIDGIFGPQTRAAVLSFGYEYGYNNNGEVGVRTWNSLCRLGMAPPKGSNRFPSVASDMGCYAGGGPYNPYFGGF